MINVVLFGRCDTTLLILYFLENVLNCQLSQECREDRVRVSQCSPDRLMDYFFLSSKIKRTLLHRKKSLILLRFIFR